MTQLAANVDADDELWTLDTLPTPEAPYVEVGDELVEVRSRFPSSYYTLTGETLPPKIRVRRGIAGTTAASHLSGVTLTPTYGLGGGAGGGAIAVDNTVDPPAEITTLIAPGADVSVPDQATLVVLANPVTAQLNVTPLSGDEDYLVFIQAPEDYELGFGELVQVQDFLANTIWGLNIFGQVSQQAVNPELNMEVDGGGHLYVSAAGDGGTRFLHAVDSSSRVVFQVLVSGAIITGANAAPTDASLAAGHMALWLDSTNGAGKLKIKAKTANGTVVTGEVALA